MRLLRFREERPGAMTCRELADLVTEYLEDALPPAERQRFEAHLEACESCLGHLAQMRRTIELLGTLGDLRLPDDVRDELVLAFRDWKQGAA